jgi:hypothetical protein
MAQSQASLPGHPAPHRGRVGGWMLAFALLAAPAAWAIQGAVDYSISSHACYPHDRPVPHLAPGWEWLYPLLLAVNIAGLAVGLAAALVAWRAWRLTRNEHHRGGPHLLEAGEGRSRFLAACGMMLGVGFMVAIVANTVALFMVPSCIG